MNALAAAAAAAAAVVAAMTLHDLVDVPLWMSH